MVPLAHALPTRSLPSVAPVLAQAPLIHVVESDDLYLENLAGLCWFAVIRKLDWRALRPIAARYYEALWQFNEAQAQARARATPSPAAEPETRQQATQRLLLERATLCEDILVLHQPPVCKASGITVDPLALAPGVTPVRWAGRAPKCFFAMFKAFMAMALRARPPEPGCVHEELLANPAFARACGFTVVDARCDYRQSDVPSLRKLEQFDQIMTDNGLWGTTAVAQVADNIKRGRIRKEHVVVHDTTHLRAFSSMQSVEVSEPMCGELQDTNGSSAQDTCGSAERHTNTAGPTRNKKRKSHPRTIKRCRCKDRNTCPHPWVNADDGAGTVVKAGGKMHWAHKASTLGFPEQGILLDAVALSDAASHDSQSLGTHLYRLFELHPELEGTVTRVLDDGAADDASLKSFFRKEWDIELLAPINPRGRRPITDDLPRGIDHLTATGVPTCRAGHGFELLGSRRDPGRFIFRAPDDEHGVPVCRECPLRSQCCRGDAAARQVTIPHERLPWLDPEFPQLSKRFAAAMAQRTSIERLHKQMKYDYGDERLTKRGNAAFQARLDKTLLAMHLVIAHE